MSNQYTYNSKLLGLVLFVSELILCGLSALVFLILKNQITGLKLDHEILLVVLAAGPIFSLLFFFYIKWKNKALQRFGDTRLLPYFAQPISTGKTAYKYLLYRVAFSALAIALVNPKIGSQVAEGKSTGIDVMFCIDVSNSMLAEDIQPNRLTRALRAVEQTLDRLHGDRVGIVVFAGEAYMQLPITNDYGAAKLFLSTISPSLIPTQGTSISSAIDMAMDGFDFEKQSTGKAIVVITDGESHDGDAMVSAEHAADNKVPVYCIGMGTTQGAPIPLKTGRGNDFKKDKNGTVVISKINEQALAEIAISGKGIFIRATNQDAGVDLLVKELNKQTKSEVDSVVYVDYEDRFQWFAAIAFILLSIEILLTDKKSRWVEKINWFNAD